MKIRTFSKLDNGVYQVSINTEDWSEGDRALMLKYGEPSIDLGGDFFGEVPYQEFTLSANLVLIMSESPFTQRFDSRDYADADERAELWKTTIIDVITQAIIDLRAQEDTFTREELATV